MLWYYFTITYHMDGEQYPQGTSYGVAAPSRTIAWKKAAEYATALYGRYLMKLDLHTVSTY